jgi:hypothetical protein
MLLVVGSLALTATACGPDNTGNGDGGRDGTATDATTRTDGFTYDLPPLTDAVDHYLCPGMGTEVTGTVLSPNGQDPIFGAVVYVTHGEPAAISPGVACDSCAVPPDALGFAVTGADGSFSIPHAFDEGGAVNVVIQKGRFRRIVRLSTSGCNPQMLTSAQTSLPGASGTDVSFPRILVPTTVNDDIGTVLTRIGITEFDMMDGCRRAATAADIMACPLGQLLADPARIAQYNMILLPCGALGNFHTWQVLPPGVITGLQGFLQAGGRLYSSDLSYGVIQRPFPDAFTFAGGTTLSQNGNDPADVGLGGSRTTPRSYEGIIDDPDLLAWMSGRGALLANNHVSLTEFINPWGAVDRAGANATTWVHASVPWHDASGAIIPDADHPLTVEATYRGMNGAGCGRVVYTSYHTNSTTTGPLTPQERVLEWLIFELGGCVTPG